MICDQPSSRRVYGGGFSGCMGGKHLVCGLGGLMVLGRLYDRLDDWSNPCRRLRHREIWWKQKYLQAPNQPNARRDLLKTRHILVPLYG